MSPAPFAACRSLQCRIAATLHHGVPRAIAFTLATMTMAKFPLPVRSSGTSPRGRRWWVLAVLGISLLLHLVAIGWLNDTLHMPSPVPAPAPVVLASLQTPPPDETRPVSKPKPKRKSRNRPQPQVAPPPVDPMPVVSAVSAQTTISEAEGTDADGGDTASGATAAATAPETEEVAGQQQGKSYKIDLPPSADLQYDVQKTVKNGEAMYGRGTIKWRTDGAHYTVDGEAGVLFFTVLRFRSEGSIETYGVAPELYSEKRFRKSETATHFHRERNTISFSASTKSYPRTGGEQDRASVIWQLAAIGRGDSEQFARGAHIDLMVAGTRDADIWRMVVVGEEAIEIDGQTIAAWHVSRTPRPGSYEQKLDIWLAPTKEWYPLRLRYTEINGDFLDMSLADLNVLPAP